MTTKRQRFITRPLLRKMRSVVPTLSDTEQQALEAGDIWWDAELLSGKPDWSKLVEIGKPTLSEEEQAFLDGPVKTVCGMVNDWTSAAGVGHVRRWPRDRKGFADTLCCAPCYGHVGVRDDGRNPAMLSAAP